MTELKQTESLEADKIYKNRGSSDGQAQIMKKIETRKECGCGTLAFCAHQALHEVYIGRHRRRQSSFQDECLAVMRGFRSTVHVLRV